MIDFLQFKPNEFKIVEAGTQDVFEALVKAMLNPPKLNSRARGEGRWYLHGPTHIHFGSGYRVYTQAFVR
jgi:hypothetical protein